MVFIHGGTFYAGAGSMGAYDGAYLAASGNVVVVTINYRLGALGWLAADTLQISIPPNLGLQDQQLALQWVQANIGAFGGDSTQVTLFGESAGAMSVGLHLFAAPASAPLFRAAIMESNLMSFPYRPTAQAQGDGAGFVGQLCPATNCTGTMAWLQGLTTEQIMLADSAYRGGLNFLNRVAAKGLSELLPWSPVMDGTIVVGQPSNGYAAGMPAKPYVFGMNHDEGVLFSALVAASLPAGTSLNEWEYDAFVLYMYPNDNNFTITGFDDPGGYEVHPYNGNEADTTAFLTSQESALSNVLNDGLFHCGNLASADSALTANQPDSIPVFGYLFVQPPVFNHPPPAVPPCVPQAGNVCHTYELPYVFNNFAYWAAQPGSGQPAAADSALAQAMSAAWVSFATTLGPPTAGWQPYTANGGLYTWGGTSSGTMLQGWSGARNCTALWDSVPPLGH
jgi:para-nitrobenzyl esterase